MTGLKAFDGFCRVFTVTSVNIKSFVCVPTLDNNIVFKWYRHMPEAEYIFMTLMMKLRPLLLLTMIISFIQVVW